MMRWRQFVMTLEGKNYDQLCDFQMKCSGEKQWRKPVQNQNCITDPSRSRWDHSMDCSRSGFREITGRSFGQCALLFQYPCIVNVSAKCAGKETEIRSNDDMRGHWDPPLDKGPHSQQVIVGIQLRMHSSEFFGKPLGITNFQVLFA